MLKKIYQADFLLLPEQEFWHMYILLRKGKDFYYECAGRSTEKPPDAKGFYDYEHACFTLDGQVLSVNKKMRPSLITYIQKTIKDNQEKFRKEIEMATKTIFEKKVSQVTNELGELLKKKDHREAWTKAGELNSLLKKEEAKDLKPDLIEKLQTELRGYYYINGEIEKPISAFMQKDQSSLSLLVSKGGSMDKAKRYLLQAKEYLSHFKKVEKKGGPPKLKVTNKKTVNIAVIGGISFLLFVGFLGSIRAITLSNKVSTLQAQVESTQKQQTQPMESSRKYDYKLQYYLNDYVYAYFTLPQESDKQKVQVDYLNKFYNFIPDVKSQGQVRNPSSLVYSQLMTVEGKVATYKVKYKESIHRDNNTEEKEIVTGFNIPFDEKDGKYYVSGLPWFSAIESSQAGHFSEDDKLQLTANDHFSDSERKKVEKFLKVFFTNYTTSQDNLNLIAKDVDIIANSTFKTIDYTYLKQDGDDLIAYVQATFEVGGTTHSENFTFILSEKEKTYYVSKLEHTIPLNYANDKE